MNPDKVPWSRNPTLKQDDILIVRSGAYTGDSAIVPSEWMGAIAGYDMVFTASNISPAYMAFNLLSNHVLNGQFELAKNRAAQPHLNAEELGNVVIALPPLEEQKLITHFLDYKTAQIDALIAKKELLLKKLAQKRTAIISHAVTKGLDPSVPMKDSGVPLLGNIPASWQVMPVKFALEMPITDGPHETPKFYDEGIPFISAEAVKNDELDFERKRGFISQEDHIAYSKKYKPKYGDVYMVKSGATTGNVARVLTSLEFNIWSPLAVLRPHKDKSLTDFIFYVIKSKHFLCSVELSWSFGTQQNIGMGVVSNIRIALPPISEQKIICNFLEKQSHQIIIQQQKINEAINKLKEYRTSIITHAVTGKIDVRNVPIPKQPEAEAA